MSEFLFLRGLDHEDEGRIEDAKELYRESIRQETSSMINLARLSPLEDSLTLLKAVLLIDPDHLLANFNLACILHKQGNHTDARRHYMRAGKLEDALYNLIILDKEESK